jgi:hypothetical protein
VIEDRIGELIVDLIGDRISLPVHLRCSEGAPKILLIVDRDAARVIVDALIVAHE